MSSRSPLPIHPCPFWSLITLHIVLLIFSIALLCIGTRVRADSASEQTVNGYTQSTCTLEAAQVTLCPANKGWIAVFKRSEDGGTSTVADPFALKTTKAEAESQFNDYPFNVSLPCMCNKNNINPFPALTCNMNDACMMNVRMVQYMQTVGFVYG